MIASSITEAIEINVCHPFNLRDPSQTLSIKKLKGIYRLTPISGNYIKTLSLNSY